MNIVGIFAGNISGDLLNHKLFYNTANDSFYVEGQDIPLSKFIIKTLNQQKAIQWIDIDIPTRILGEPLTKTASINTPVDENIIKKYNEEYRQKNMYNITQEDYLAAIKNPSQVWSSYFIGLYLLKNGNISDAQKYLKDFIIANPFDYQAYSPLMSSTGKSVIIEEKEIPLKLPPKVSEETISQKYLKDFLSFKYKSGYKKISSVETANFIFTVLTTSLFFGFFLYTFIISL